MITYETITRFRERFQALEYKRGVYSGVINEFTKAQP